VSENPMRESEDRLIDAICKRVNPEEREDFINGLEEDLEKGLASPELIERFKERLKETQNETDKK
jgi:hypothetical protein